MKATHALSLYVNTATPEQFNTVFDRLTLQAKALGDEYPYVGVSSHLMGDDVELESDDALIYDEDTMRKVHDAIFHVIGGTRDNPTITDIINQMQDYGILFRERRPA